MALALGVSAVLGCEDPPAEPITPPPDPEIVRPTRPTDEGGALPAGHLSREQRGLALDQHDVTVLVGDPSQLPLAPEALKAAFARLVVHRPFVNTRSEQCLRSALAPDELPAAKVNEAVELLRTRIDLEFDAVAVNVSLLNPGRRGLSYVCFDEGATVARFDVPEHRARLISAFEALARLPRITHLTVGVEMNRYYHLSGPGGDRLTDDYTNFVTLYREIYDAVKAINPEIRVGPGLSWATFRRRTVPEIADELDLAPASAEATWAAAERTVLPLLRIVERRGGEERRIPKADFLGLSMIPFDTEAPFRGEPDPSSAEGVEAVLDYYLDIPLVSDGLPVVLSVVDWPDAASTASGSKGPYLKRLKQGVSHVEIEWAAWRRYSDLPRTPPETSTCGIFTGSSDPALAYPIDYCAAGMTDVNGRPRDVYEEFVIDP